MAKQRKPVFVFYLAALLLAVAVALTINGCRTKDYLKFDHLRHDDHGIIECKKCHPFVDGKYAEPTHENCKDCHEIPEGQVNESCLQCHHQEKPTGKAEVVQVKFNDVLAGHAKHTALKCEHCHTYDAQQKTMTFMGHDGCFSCHQKEKNQEKCEYCHREIRKNYRPPSHTQTFLRTHGTAQAAIPCEFCHGPNGCDECHHTKKPSTHGAGWTKEYHGKEALRNRGRCAFCHEGSFCDRCHEQKPYSHFQPNYNRNHGGPAKLNPRACATCHPRQFCMECHNNPKFLSYP